MEPELQKVIDYYNSAAIDYKLLWTGRQDLAMHFGYTDGSKYNHVASLHKMNEVLAGMAAVTEADVVLDAGCGYGGSAIWLAKNTGARVVGVNIVPRQVEEARKAAKKLGVERKVTFALEDYTCTTFADNSFSVVWGLESIVHASDKAGFLKEAYRLLKPGGRLLIAEYMLRDEPLLTAEEKSFIAPWLRGWAMPGLLSSKEYIHLFESTGFKQIVVRDITKQVRPSLMRLKSLLTLRAWPAKVLWRLKVISKEHYGNVEATVCQMKALDMGLWRYKVITAVKD